MLLWFEIDRPCVVFLAHGSTEQVCMREYAERWVRRILLVFRKISVEFHRSLENKNGTAYFLCSLHLDDLELMK